MRCSAQTMGPTRKEWVHLVDCTGWLPSHHCTLCVTHISQHRLSHLFREENLTSSAENTFIKLVFTFITLHCCSFFSIVFAVKILVSVYTTCCFKKVVHNSIAEVMRREENCEGLGCRAWGMGRAVRECGAPKMWPVQMGWAANVKCPSNFEGLVQKK